MDVLEVTDPDDVAETLATIDYFFGVIAAVRATKPRDPLRAVEDALLELRAKVDTRG